MRIRRQEETFPDTTVIRRDKQVDRDKSDEEDGAVDDEQVDEGLLETKTSPLESVAKGDDQPGIIRGKRDEEEDPAPASWPIIRGEKQDGAEEKETDADDDQSGLIIRHTRQADEILRGDVRSGIIRGQERSSQIIREERGDSEDEIIRGQGQSGINKEIIRQNRAIKSSIIRGRESIIRGQNL